MAAELAANVQRHAGSGRVLVRRGAGHVEIVAIDSGPGFEPPPVEGLSTRGGLGIGLGAIHRLSDSADLYSRPGLGTVFAVRIGSSRPPRHRRAHPGRCRARTSGGDGYASRTDEGKITLMVCDGLGHGPLAASAAQAAIRAFEDAPAGPPAQLVKHVHGEISHTRGAALAIAQADGGTLTFAGLGNIAATVVDRGDHQGLISLPGIAGHRAAAIRQYDYPLPPGAPDRHALRRPPAALDVRRLSGTVHPPVPGDRRSPAARSRGPPGRRRGARRQDAVMTSGELLSMEVLGEGDVFTLRQRARVVAGAVGLEQQDQVRLATALSEVGREVLQQAGGARMAFTIDGSLRVRVRGYGPLRLDAAGSRRRPGWSTRSHGGGGRHPEQGVAPRPLLRRVGA